MAQYYRPGGIMALIAYGAQDINMIAPKSYNSDRDNLNQTPLTPTEFAALPDGITVANFTEPISLEEPKKGEIYGFCVENGRWYLAGSLNDLNMMIKTRFGNSSNSSVFVPFKNALVASKDIQWVRL